ncbi:site-specific integrase [Lunatibacter salilacus]|uniref:site-specific integrase n=1 Tax=Lunatibacter salilacus TaxID=2483804 RepID=UPI00131E1E30|nr:site-specific integrase [Lunatibacter salilacus]
MKCTFYLDRPYNPEIDSESLKSEIASAREKKRNLALKYLNPKPTSVYVFFSPDKSLRLKYRTSVKIQSKYWDFKNGIVKAAAPAAMELNSELNSLSSDILKAAVKIKDENKVISKSAYQQILKATIDKKILILADNNLDGLIEEFKNHKAIYTSEGTMKEYRTVFKALIDYQKASNIALSLPDFNSSFFVQFEKFLSGKENPLNTGRGLLNDTIYKYISTLKVFLTWCGENGHPVHPDASKPHKSPYKKKAHNEIVVLTEPELNRIYELDLSGHPTYERVRDLFCFACFTGQRFSDIFRFSAADFKDNKWSFLSAKTKKKVTVPFEGFLAKGLDILKKYDFVLPKISNQKFNDYIKEVGKLAEIDDPVKITRFSGKNEIIIQKPKYEFMSSHMGRRTMVTILLSKGVPVTLVQKITQHSDIRTLMKYESAGMDSLIDALKRF